MKRIIISAITFILLFAGCVAERPISNEVVLTAYQESALSSRTCVDNGGTQVLWEPEDEINVFFRGEGAKFVSQNSSPSGIAEFKGSLTTIIGLNEGSSGSNTLWALYPYREDAVSAGSTITTVLPSEQTGKNGSFASKTQITIARSNSYDLAFYNVTGGIRFTLTHSGIQSVTLKGNGNEPLAGKAAISYDGNYPTVSNVLSPETEITLTAPDESGFETGVWYYIVAFPTELSQGFTLTFRTSDSEAVFNTNSSRTITRGNFGSIAEVDKYLDFGGGESGDIGPIEYLYGKWTLVRCYEQKESGAIEDVNMGYDDFGYYFDKDGTGYLFASIGSYSSSEALSWTVSDNTITMDVPTAGLSNLQMIIMKLTTSELVLDITAASGMSGSGTRGFYVMEKR